MGWLYTSTPSPIRSLIWTALVESSPGRQSWVDVTRTGVVPLGTAESSPGRQSWVDVTRTGVVPLGTAESSPRRQSWVDVTRTGLVPEGRLRVAQDVSPG